MKLPQRKRQTVQQTLRQMLTNPVSRGMAKVIQANLRKREDTPLLRMVKENPLMQATLLLAATKGMRAR